MDRKSSIIKCILLWFTCLIFILLVSCRTTQKAVVDLKDLSYLYNPTKSTLRPRFNVLNETDITSIISVKFFASELFFSEANPQGVPMAQLLITVKLYNISNIRTLADTSYLDVDIVKGPSRQEYVYKLQMKVEPGEDYIAEVKILDKLRTEVIQSFVSFDTRSPENMYNFVAKGHFMKNELFNTVIRKNEYVDLLYPSKTIDSLFISYFRPLKEVPYPPSMMLPEKIIDYQPDTIVALHYADTLSLMFPNEGLYFCSISRKSEEGFTFKNFGENYPNMTKTEVMIDPLTYIASQQEMDMIRFAPRPKVALDDFWIRCGGNIEKSRELIRIYYTRVLYSNYYFTSFKEGWRTERGMIYTIYGPPDKVYKSSDGESWGYRKPVLKSLWGGRYRLKDNYIFFNFKVRKNKYADNDFYLSRNETLVTYWDKAVASWRKGMVFRLDNPEDL